MLCALSAFNDLPSTGIERKNTTFNGGCIS